MAVKHPSGVAAGQHDSQQQQQQQQHPGDASTATPAPSSSGGSSSNKKGGRGRGRKGGKESFRDMQHRAVEDAAKAVVAAQQYDTWLTGYEQQLQQQ